MKFLDKIIDRLKKKEEKRDVLLEEIVKKNREELKKDLDGLWPRAEKINIIQPPENFFGPTIRAFKKKRKVINWKKLRKYQRIQMLDNWGIDNIYYPELKVFISQIIKEETSPEYEQ